MTWILLFALLAILALVFASLKLKNSPTQEDSFPYEKSGPLFSEAERSFLGVLQQAVGEEFAVLGKVRIADVVNVRSMSNHSARTRAFNRISAKHFDYVICAKTDYSVICVVELDDKSHQQRKRKERDAFLVGLCHAVSLPLLQIPAQRAYSVTDIQKKFEKGIGGSASSALNASTYRSPVQSNSEILPATFATTNDPPSIKEIIKVDLNTEDPLCPQCSATMVLREIKTGSKAGQKFWGCSTFPKCHGVMVSSQVIYIPGIQAD